MISFNLSKYHRSKYQTLIHHRIAIAGTIVAGLVYVAYGSLATSATSQHVALPITSPEQTVQVQTVTHQVIAPAKYIAPSNTEDGVKAIATQVASTEQKAIADNAVIEQQIATQKSLAEQKAIAEKAEAEAKQKLRGQPGQNYPWATAPYYSDSADPWGMYKRQCVSYVAWKVASSGRTMPYWGGKGNANRWDENARSAGISVDSNPRIGDVAVDNSGYYGHAMFVEDVYADGTILVSQYNAQGNGTYSEERTGSAGLVFIHF